MKIVYSIRNILWYRRFRNLPCRSINHVTGELGCASDTRLALTELLLGSVGLRVSEDSHELDGIYLTAIQKSAIAKVEVFGYHAGLG